MYDLRLLSLSMQFCVLGLYRHSLVHSLFFRSCCSPIVIHIQRYQSQRYYCQIKSAMLHLLHNSRKNCVRSRQPFLPSWTQALTLSVLPSCGLMKMQHCSFLYQCQRCGVCFVVVCSCQQINVCNLCISCSRTCCRCKSSLFNLWDQIAFIWSKKVIYHVI